MYSNALLIQLYIDYVNNFLTLECFAEYYGYTLDEARFIIDNGRILNNKLT